MITLGAKLDHGFDEPLGLLSDCRRRIEHFLDVLVRVCIARAGGELPAEEREALQRGTESSTASFSAAASHAWGVSFSPA